MPIHPRRRLYSLIYAAAWATLCAGCGEDDVAETPASIYSTKPRGRAPICWDSEITVVFTRDPGDVQSVGAWLEPDGQTGVTRTFRSDGVPTVSFEWEHGGSAQFEYSIAVCEYDDAAYHVWVVPEDGKPTLASRRQVSGVVLRFNEAVRAPDGDWSETFVMTDVDGHEWALLVTVDDKRVTLKAPEPGVFTPGRTYTVRGIVSDRHGNLTEVQFAVVTKEEA
jgi:hypothetical protein